MARNNLKIVLSLVSLLSVATPTAAVDSAATSDAASLLTGVGRRLESLPPLSMKVEAHAIFDRPSTRNKVTEEINRTVIHHDGDRVDVKTDETAVSGGVPRETYRKRTIWTGEQNQSRQKGTRDDSAPLATIQSKNSALDAFRSVYNGGFLDGFIGSHHLTVDQLLLQTGRDVRVREQAEEVDGVACRVVEGAAETGRYVLWIDPVDYVVRRATVEKSPGDTLHGSPIPKVASASEDPYSLSIELKDVKTESVEGHVIPVSATLLWRIHKETGVKRLTTFQARRSDITLNPDFEKEGAFVMDGIPDGTRVVSMDNQNLRYVWLEGKAVFDATPAAVAEIDRLVAREADALAAGDDGTGSTKSRVGWIVLIVIIVGAIGTAAVLYGKRRARLHDALGGAA